MWCLCKCNLYNHYLCFSHSFSFCPLQNINYFISRLDKRFLRFVFVHPAAQPNVHKLLHMFLSQPSEQWDNGIILPHFRSHPVVSVHTDCTRACTCTHEGWCYVLRRCEDRLDTLLLIWIRKHGCETVGSLMPAVTATLTMILHHILRSLAACTGLWCYKNLQEIFEEENCWLLLNLLT